MGHLVQANEVPLSTQVMIESFEKWAINFVGPINHTSLNKKHILVCTDFVTKWVEAKAVSFATQKLLLIFCLMNFLLDLVFLEKLFLTMDRSLFLTWYRKS